MSNISDYKEIQSINQPDETLLKNIGLVKRVALHLQGRIPKFMELDELIQVGTIGLIEASKSFDANKGVDFEIFAKKTYSWCNLRSSSKNVLSPSVSNG